MPLRSAGRAAAWGPWRRGAQHVELVAAAAGGRRAGGAGDEARRCMGAGKAGTPTPTPRASPWAGLGVQAGRGGARRRGRFPILPIRAPEPWRR